MRALIAFSTIALFAAIPASAQMCGGGEDGASSMCGGMKAQAAAPAAGAAQSPAKTSGCACCQNMAMMQPPKEGEAMPGMDMPGTDTPGAEMPGMDMPAPEGETGNP